MLWKFIILLLIIIAVVTFCTIGGRNLIVLVVTIELLFFSAGLAFLVTFYNNPGEQ